MKEDNSLASCLGLLLLFIAMLVIGIPLNGWVLSIMWAWFVVPVFDAPALSVAQAVGLSCIVSFLRARSISSNNSGEKKSTNEVILNGIGDVFLSPLMSLGLAYIVYQFIK